MSIVGPCGNEDKAYMQLKKGRSASDSRTEVPQVGAAPNYAKRISAREVKSGTNEIREAIEPVIAEETARYRWRWTF
jgi:hypothetical protein